MIAGSFARLSTGIKMLLILLIALLPLGIIALATSIEAANTNRLSREVETRVVAADIARQLSAAIGRSALELTDVAGKAIASPGPRAACRDQLAALARTQRLPAAFAIYRSNGGRLCATPNFSREPVDTSLDGIGTEVRLLDIPDVLRFSIGVPGHVAVGELPRATIARLARPIDAIGNSDLSLRQGEATVTLFAAAGLRTNRLAAVSPVARGQLQLELVTGAAPMRALETLMVALPILMWLAAALTGWLVVDRLLLRPLARMERAITAYGVGDRELVLPAMRTPAQEIRSLGEAFRGVTERLAGHEAELEQGLARQTRLTREVHHRVKNNLQVVASLINIHARGVDDPQVRAAYATIQRRVDALAVVHRNHFAELEESRGVGLRLLISELAQNLRATAPPEAASLLLTLELLPAYAHQDTALPVAFLVTEVVEIVMNSDPRGGVTIRLAATDKPTRARLSFVAPALAGDGYAASSAGERFRRIVQGLSRQLRSPLEIDEDAGSLAIEIPIVAD